jgi:hypothetical protein
LIDREAGRDVVKPHPNTTRKPPPKGQAHAVDLSEPWNLIRLCTFVTLGSVASSLVIGAWRGGLDSILVSLAIAGVISLTYWVMTLFFVTLIVIPGIALRLFRRVCRGSHRSPEVRGGVADGWLDGPP